MRQTWKPISWTSWIASSRDATKRRQCVGHIFRKRMVRAGHSASRPSKISSCSFGFRPGRSAHQALQSLHTAIMSQRLRWVIDIDIVKYFDSIPHSNLRDFLDQRVTDGVIRRMIDKWLKAGVLEEMVSCATRPKAPHKAV